MPRRKKKKLANYKIEEAENERLQSSRNVYHCTSCADPIDIGNTRGEFNCPNCGWPNKVN